MIMSFLIKALMLFFLSLLVLVTVIFVICVSIYFYVDILNRNNFAKAVPHYISKDMTVLDVSWPVSTLFIMSGGGFGCYSGLFQLDHDIAETIMTEKLAFFANQDYSTEKNFKDWKELDFPWSGDDFKSLALGECTRDLDAFNKIRRKYLNDGLQASSYVSCGKQSGACLLVIPSEKIIVLGGWD